jgi:MFS family permease
MAAVPPSARGRASGLLTTAFFAGQFVSPIVSGASMSAFGLAGTFQAFALFQAALAMALAVMAIHIPRRAERQ